MYQQAKTDTIIHPRMQTQKGSQISSSGISSFMCDMSLETQLVEPGMVSRWFGLSLLPSTFFLCFVWFPCLGVGLVCGIMTFKEDE
jgi:hypothetical protein